MTINELPMNIPFPNKLQAGILPLVLGLSIIISAICFSMLMLAYYANIQVSRYKVDQKLKRNAQSGINVLLASSDSRPSYPKEIDLFGEEKDSVRIFQKPWGMYRFISSMAHQGTTTYLKQSLIGQPAMHYLNHCLYLADLQQPLQLIGETLLVGNAFLPKSGVKPGSFGKRGYKREELLYGNMEMSEQELPAISVNPDLILGTNLELYYLLQNIDSPYGHYDFNDSHTYYLEASTVLLDDSVSENLIIKAADVRITSQAYTNDLVVYANNVVIEDGFEGSLQVFVTGDLEIGQGSRLNYPSGIARMGDTHGSLRIGSGSTIVGYVINLISNGSKNRSSIILEPGSEVSGILYCKGSVELSGATINGMVFTDQIKHSSPSGVEFNLLVDTQINFADNEYSGIMPIGFDGNRTFMTIVKWLSK